MFLRLSRLSISIRICLTLSVCLILAGCENKPGGPATASAPAVDAPAEGTSSTPAAADETPAADTSPESSGSVPTGTAAGANTLTPDELSAGWILLFDGETLFGWEPETQADWKAKDGVIQVDAGEAGLLCTTTEFGDYELRVDFRSPPKTNSGIFLRTSRTPKDPAIDCYELNIADAGTSEFPTGSFVGRQKAKPGEYDTDGWQTYHVKAEAGHFRVSLDGQEVLDYTDPKPILRGPIGLQLNSGPVEFRNIKLRPLGLVSLFNGQDLTGWNVLPDHKSEFQVVDETINVKNGNGALESEAQFADFVLQVEIYSAGEHLNSGIFFRSIPGEFWQGYESQIQNGFKDGDRTKPLDCGTGGFYRRQDARLVMPNDFEWFSKTLIVNGNRMATWVNGYPVCDWSDTREPNENPRQGLRREAGTLQIQGHDPTTNLSFRNIQAAELPGPATQP